MMWIGNFQVYLKEVSFIGEASFILGKQVVNLIKSKYYIGVLPVSTTSKVGDYFSFKSDTHRSLTSNVVYNFCYLKDANVTYIGQSNWHLITTVEEHTSKGKNNPQSVMKITFINVKTVML